MDQEAQWARLPAAQCHAPAAASRHVSTASAAIHWPLVASAAPPYVKPPLLTTVASIVAHRLTAAHWHWAHREEGTTPALWSRNFSHLCLRTHVWPRRVEWTHLTWSSPVQLAQLRPAPSWSTGSIFTIRGTKRVWLCSRPSRWSTCREMSHCWTRSTDSWSLQIPQWLTCQTRRIWSAAAWPPSPAEAASFSPSLSISVSLSQHCSLWLPGFLLFRRAHWAKH